MPTVTGHLVYPDGSDARGLVAFYLVTTQARRITQAYDVGSGETVIAQSLVRLVDGVYTVDLKPNTELAPADTRWVRVAQTLGQWDRHKAVATLLVPPGPGTYNEIDLLSELPASPGDVETMLEVLSQEVDALQRDPEAAVRRFRQALEQARAGIHPSAMVAFVGDSITEGFNATARGNRWVEHLQDILGGPVPSTGLGRGSYVAAAANTFAVTSSPASSWPGGSVPWTYSGGPPGRVDAGMSLHAVTLTGGDFMELPYHGDIVSVLYTRSPTGPTHAAVSIDGGAASVLNANGTLANGQIATFGPIGSIADHTMRVTVTGTGELIMEGAIVCDDISFPFGVPSGGLYVLGAGHAGFATTHFTPSLAWAHSLAAPGSGIDATHGAQLVCLVLGVNDTAAAPGSGGSATEYQANLTTLMESVDTAFTARTRHLPGIGLIELPGLPADWVEAAWRAAIAHDPARCSVLDLTTEVEPGQTPVMGILDSGGHPGDGGQLWLARRIAHWLDPKAGL